MNDHSPLADFMVSPLPLEAPSLILGGTYLPPTLEVPPAGAPPAGAAGAPGSCSFFFSPSRVS